jgi:hypothetical protein
VLPASEQDHDGQDHRRRLKARLTPAPIPIEHAMNMLRDTDESVVSIPAARGYFSQTAFAAALTRLTGEVLDD